MWNLNLRRFGRKFNKSMTNEANNVTQTNCSLPFRNGKQQRLSLTNWKSISAADLLVVSTSI